MWPRPAGGKAVTSGALPDSVTPTGKLFLPGVPGQAGTGQVVSLHPSAVDCSLSPCPVSLCPRCSFCLGWPLLPFIPCQNPFHPSRGSLNTPSFRKSGLITRPCPPPGGSDSSIFWPHLGLILSLPCCKDRSKLWVPWEVLEHSSIHFTAVY